MMLASSSGPTSTTGKLSLDSTTSSKLTAFSYALASQRTAILGMSSTKPLSLSSLSSSPINSLDSL